MGESAGQFRVNLYTLACTPIALHTNPLKALPDHKTKPLDFGACGEVMNDMRVDQVAGLKCARDLDSQHCHSKCDRQSDKRSITFNYTQEELLRFALLSVLLDTWIIFIITKPYKTKNKIDKQVGHAIQMFSKSQSRSCK